MDEKDIRQIDEFLSLVKRTMENMVQILNEIENKDIIKKCVGEAYDRIDGITEEYLVGMTLVASKIGLQAVLEFKEE